MYNWKNKQATDAKFSYGTVTSTFYAASQSKAYNNANHDEAQRLPWFSHTPKLDSTDTGTAKT